MNSDEAEIKPGWLNKRSMAKSLGISVQAFDKWGVTACGKVGRQTFFECRSVVENRLEHDREKSNRADAKLVGDDNNIIFQEFRLVKERADKLELQNEVSRAKLIPIELLSEILSEISGEIASKIDTIPSQVKRKHPQLDSQLIDDIKWHCVKVQNAISRLDEIIEDKIDDLIADAEAG